MKTRSLLLVIIVAGCCAWAALFNTVSQEHEDLRVMPPALVLQPQETPPSMAAKPGSVTRAKKINASAPSGCVNVNRSDLARLTLLPGIGPALAQRVIAHRESIGHFAGPDDLLAVKGIGPARLEKIRRLICF